MHVVLRIEARPVAVKGLYHFALIRRRTCALNHIERQNLIIILIRLLLICLSLMEKVATALRRIISPRLLRLEHLDFCFLLLLN